MNDTTWDFLTPWLEILSHVVFIPRADAPLNGSDKDDGLSLQPPVRYLGIDPFRPMVRLIIRDDGRPDVKAVAAIGCAMELVALALRVEPRVWRLLRDQDGEPLVDLAAYDPNDLGAGILVKCESIDLLGTAYAALFMLDESYLEPYNGQTLPYDADKKRLQEMLAGSQVSPSAYQIPLTITIERWTGEASISAIQKFFDVVALCWNVKTAVHSGRLLMRRRWAYHLKDVYVEACHGTREEVARLEASGVSITGATNAHFMSHETVQSIVGVNSWSRLKTLEINATSHEELARLYSALSCGQHIGALSVRFRVTENLGALAQVLLRTAGNCTALHRVHVDMGHEPLDLVACAALGKAGDVALRGPRRHARMLQKVHKNMATGDVLPLLCGSGYSKKVLVVLSDGNAIEVVSSAVEAFDEPTAECLSSPIETFSLRAKAADELAAMAITKLVQRCLPQCLKVLTLDVAAFDDACLALILESFPRLQTLRIKDARMRTADPLLAAYKDKRCKIRALELGAYGLDVTELLRALGDPSTRIAKTLKQLQLNCPYDDEPRETFLAAVKMMLSLNDTLEFVKLSKLRDDRAEVSEQLRPFREVVLPTRSKLALLSAVHAAASTDSMLGAMDCQIVNLIMRMAETPRLRVVCVE